jgi:hypothetical protein
MNGGFIVTDMLAAVLNICTQEELNKSVEEPASDVVVVDRDKAERRKVIKNKILAVGRISHMFSILRYANHFFMSLALYYDPPSSDGFLTFFYFCC